MFTTQGEEADPQVVAAVHMLPGLVSEQMYLLFLSCWALAAKKLAIDVLTNRSEPHQMATRCCTFIRHLYSLESAWSQSMMLTRLQWFY